MRCNSIADLHQYCESLESNPKGTRIIISTDATCCLLQGAREVADAFQEEIDRRGLADRTQILLSGCLGFCEIEPMVILSDQNILYQKVKAKDVPQIIEKSILGDEVIDRLLFRDPVTKKRKRNRDLMTFYQKQNRLILGNNERIHPTSIDDYLAVGGYRTAARVLFEKTPEEVIDEIETAGLRGRGGGGFPTARKWRSCRKAPSDDGVRYVICNADEGDPGAYMDRSVLEGNPHSVIEGMIIGSLAVGSHHGYVYVRAEYPLAVEHLEIAVRDAESIGLLGDNILGSGHSFQIKIVQGAGAFVCGESTALMASIEGRVGRPRAKYVHTVEKGLHDRPTVLNNVETWANVARIMQMGAEEFRGIGTEGSPGTKIFSLVGKINNTGLVEVPMGITLREIIFDIGGGIPGKREFKAVQTGGPSGGCLPEELLDLPVDFDELTKVGSMMGSGGMIVMDEDTCMVDVARYFTSFLKSESCGKCVACREGVARLSEILERICAGEGIEEDIDTIEDLGEYLADSSLCALGSTAPNPVLTTLKYFKHEYDEHIHNHYCRSGVCKNLFQFEIESEPCTGCTACLKVCPTDAILGERKQPHEIQQDLCIKCGECYAVCKFDAIEKARVGEVVL